MAGAAGGLAANRRVREEPEKRQALDAGMHVKRGRAAYRARRPRDAATGSGLLAHSRRD
jgi:hypothetical protein